LAKVKDLTLKTKAKDLTFKAKAKAKDSKFALGDISRPRTTTLHRSDFPGLSLHKFTQMAKFCAITDFGDSL